MDALRLRADRLAVEGMAPTAKPPATLVEDVAQPMENYQIRSYQQPWTTGDSKRNNTATSNGTLTARAQDIKTNKGLTNMTDLPVGVALSESSPGSSSWNAVIANPSRQNPTTSGKLAQLVATTLQLMEQITSLRGLVRTLVPAGQYVRRLATVESARHDPVRNIAARALRSVSLTSRRTGQFVPKVATWMPVSPRRFHRAQNWEHHTPLRLHSQGNQT